MAHNGMNNYSLLLAISEVNHPERKKTGIKKICLFIHLSVSFLSLKETIKWP
jgi:hypothetical protein